MAGTKRPYFLTDTLALAGSASGEIVLRVGSNERFEGHSVMIQRTGNFDITAIKNDSGLPFTNADTGDPLNQSMFPDDVLDHDDFEKLDAPLIIEKSDALTISVTDTSTASNTLRCVVKGTMESLPT